MSDIPIVNVTPPLSGEPQPDPSAQAPEGEGQPGAEKRIAAITRKYRDAERSNEALSADNAALTQQLAAINSRLDGLKPQGQALPDSEFADVFGSSQTIRPTKGNPDDINAAIQAGIANAMQPFMQEQKDRDEMKVLQDQQNISLNEATESFPELRDPQSRAAQTFREVWAANPEFNAMPNGPALAAAATGWALQQEARTSNTEERKLAASPPPQVPNLNSRLESLEDDQPAKNAAMIAAIGAKASREGLTHDEMEAYVGLKMGKANAK
jgi:hypothetical protein